MAHRAVILSLMATAFLAASAQSVNNRLTDHADPMPSLVEAAWDNPVVKQWQYATSLSALQAIYDSDHLNRPIYEPEGRGRDWWGFEADTYMKYGTSTLWGSAAYRNGHERSLRWNEAVDTDFIYPYFSADSIGGDLSMERYELSGGYADTRGRWSWGATLGYKAGLYYRNVDPRPRDVTGCLDLKVGGGYNVLSDYVIALAIGYEKYKQSCDIDFKSEMGVEKIYHLSGLGNHYVRFGGTSDNIYYSANRYSLTANIFPQKIRGLSATIILNRQTLDKTLRDLNNLPLNSLWHNEMVAQFGWLGESWGVSTTFDVYKRHGDENIFGDPSGNIWPQIGSLTMYADNAWSWEVNGLYKTRFASWSAWVMPAASRNHRREIYVDPVAQMLTNDWTPSIKLGGDGQLSRRWRLEAGLYWASRLPLNCKLRLAEAVSDDAQGIVEIETQRFSVISRSSTTLGGDLRATCAISDLYVAGVALGYSHSCYATGVNRNCWRVALQFIF